MTFNLNKQWSKQDISKLLSSVKDDRQWRMFISKNGDVDLQDVYRDPDISRYWHAFFEIWLPGNGYVGEEASKDSKWIDELYRSLIENWPSLKGDRYIDH